MVFCATIAVATGTVFCGAVSVTGGADRVSPPALHAAAAIRTAAIENSAWPLRVISRSLVGRSGVRVTCGRGWPAHQYIFGLLSGVASPAARLDVVTTALRPA